MAKIDDALHIAADPTIAARITAIGKIKNSKGKLVDVPWAIATIIAQITRPLPPTGAKIGKLEFNDPDQTVLS